MTILKFFSWPSITGILLMLGLFAGEIFTHVLGNVAYVAVAVYALWLSRHEQEIHMIAVGATVLLILGYFFAISMQHPADQATFLVNRASAIIVIWFAHYFTLRYRKAQENENRQRIELEERKLDQERLRSSLEIYQAIACNFPVGWIGILDEDLTYIVANGRGLGHGANGTADIIGKKFSRTLDSDQAEAYLKEAREGKNVGFETSFNNRTFEVNAVPFPGRQKRKWIMAVVHDITTLKETEAGLVKALEKERLLGEMKSRFVTMASHEFRTPLTTIMSSASLLANYIGESYAKEKGTHITRIKRSIKLLTDMLDNLLSFGRLEDGELKPNYELFDLNEFLKEVTKEHESLKRGNQQLSVKYPEEVNVVSDRHFLKAILYNLLSNAFKYSHTTGQVEVEAEVRNGFLNLRVTDHGIGIHQDDQQHVFDLFFRGQNVVNIQGTGMGLCIVKRYVVLLGGTITFTSKIDDSTTFVVQIPSMEQ